MEKRHWSANNVSLHPLGKVLWGNIWKYTAEKSWTNATNATLPLHRQAIWEYLWKHIEGGKIKQMHSVWLVWLCILSSGKSKETSSGNPNRCCQCDYSSSQASHLKRHLKTHSGAKSNKCKQCDFVFALASNLRTHLQTQWKKAKQMWPVSLCFCSGRLFDETSANTQWGKDWTNVTSGVSLLLRQK